MDSFIESLMGHKRKIVSIVAPIEDTKEVLGTRGFTPIKDLKVGDIVQYRPKINPNKSPIMNHPILVVRVFPAPKCNPNADIGSVAFSERYDFEGVCLIRMYETDEEPDENEIFTNPHTQSKRPDEMSEEEFLEYLDQQHIDEPEDIQKAHTKLLAECIQVCAFDSRRFERVN
jgi:hypothetical protein